LDTLRDTGIDWTMGLTGGEPFLYPEFVELCKTITQAYRISIDTNLSMPSLVKEFSEAIDPRKVDYVYASTHVLERERRNGLDDFLDNVLLLRNKDFKIIVNYVFHPLVFDRFEGDYELFKSKGIRLEPKALKGEYEGKVYPKAYSSREKRLLLKHNPMADRAAPFVSKGLKCNAGKRFALLKMDGTVVRCTADKTELGSIFRGLHLNQSAEPCSVSVCPCNGQQLIVESEKVEIRKRILF
jgi:MoaA/NifB/PqqE/SkfB family radical SAM enzyme